MKVIYRIVTIDDNSGSLGCIAYNFIVATNDKSVATYGEYLDQNKVNTKIIWLDFFY